MMNEIYKYSVITKKRKKTKSHK